MILLYNWLNIKSITMPKNGVIMNLLKKFSGFTALCLAVMLAVLPFAGVAYAQEEEPLVTDGIYNIVNASSGKLLEAFDYKFDYQGRMHLDVRRNVPAQDFAIVSHSDGTYSICPQNDEGEYMMEYRAGTGEGASIYKSNANDQSNRFFISKNPDGTFRLRPVNAASFSLAESKTNFAHYYYSLCELQKHSLDDAQRWKLELTDKKIEISIELNKHYDTVKQYSVNDLYAVVTPAAYSDKVEWSSSDKKVAIVDDSGSYCAFSKGDAVITATVAGKTDSCTVTVSDKDAFTWYSQCNMYTGGWNAVAVKDLYFYANGVYKLFMIDGFNSKTDWMDEGCALCCAAMVLRNLDARMTEGYDFRSGQSGNLESDPYTCALANTYNEGSRTGKGVLNYDPIYTAMSLITSRFKVDGKAVTPTTYYYVTKQMIKEQLDKHPEGVIICMESSYRGSHYIVVTECINPDAENPNDYQFVVCDPAAYNPEDGNNVPFEESTSYKELYYRYYHMWTLITYTVAD